MILEAKFEETNHELPCDATTVVVVNEGGGGEVPNAHINNKNNPHKVSCEQIGAVAEGELADKVTEIITADVDEWGSIADAIEAVAEYSARWVAEMMMDQHGLLYFDEESGEYHRNVPTYEEVEEAIAEPQYELIQSIVTTEAETYFSFNLEADDFVLFVETPASTAASGGNVGIYKNAKQIWNLWMSNMVITAGPSHFAVYGKNDKGLCFLEYVSPSNATASQNKTVGRAPFYMEGNTPFTKLTLSNTSGFPVGTKVELWGIKK